MSRGIYGSFLRAFPELLETMMVWEEGKEPIKIRGVYIPHKGKGIERRKVSSGNWALDFVETDHIYVSHKYAQLFEVGYYFRRNSQSPLCRIVNDVEYDKSADYRIYSVEKIEGSRPDQTEELKIKEPYFA